MQNKVVVVNLEMGMPTVESALRTMRNALLTHKRQGKKAVLLIHGYGSSGTGGSIKSAVRKDLGEASLQGIVRAYSGGEQWSQHRQQFRGYCKTIEEYERQIDNNEGVTVVLLR